MSSLTTRLIRPWIPVDTSDNAGPRDGAVCEVLVGGLDDDLPLEVVLVDAFGAVGVSVGVDCEREGR